MYLLKWREECIYQNGEKNVFIKMERRMYLSKWREECIY